MCDSTLLFLLEEKKSLWIQTYFTLNLRFRKWYEFLSPGNDILLVKSASQPSTSMMMNFNHEVPEKKVQSQHSLFLLSGLCIVKITQQNTYVYSDSKKQWSCYRGGLIQYLICTYITKYFPIRGKIATCIWPIGHDGYLMLRTGKDFVI